MRDEMSTLWLVVHLLQISLFQFYAAPRLSRLTWKLLVSRNPERVTKDFVGRTQLHSSSWDYLIGSASIIFLVTGFAKGNLEIYWFGKYISIFGFLFTSLVVDLYLYEKLKGSFPLKLRRTATIVPRSFGRIVPLWAWSLCMVVSLYVASTASDVSKQLGIASAALVCLLAGIFVEKKSKITLDLQEDQLYRRSEAWTVFIVACTIPLSFAVTSYLGDFGLDALLSTVPLIAFVWFLNSKIYRKLVG